MTKNEILELREKAVNAMENLVNERNENMDADSLAAIKEFKNEIVGYDNKLEAIEEVRSVALKNSAPKEEKMKDTQKELRNAFEGYLKGDITEKELRSMNTGTGNGGDTIPEEFKDDLLEVISEYGIIYNDADKFTTADHGQLTIPVIDDTANSGVWTAEGGSITGADAATSKITMDAHKLATRVDISTELLEDSAFNMSSYLTNALGIRLSRTIESAFISGDGSNKPTGILVDAANVNSAAAGIVDIDDLRGMIFSIQPSSRKGAKFYVSDDMLKEMTSWVDADGRPLLQSSASATQANGIQYSVYGYPVTVNYELGDVVTGENPVIFGNPKSYMIRQIRNLTVKRSDDFSIDTDEIVFVATMRLDAKIVSANDSFVKITVA